MLNRRQVLKHALQGAPLVALGASAPPFLVRLAQAAEKPRFEDRILVVLELEGGNDGLNMLVPYGDDLYHNARPTLRIKPADVIRVDDYAGLNPAMKNLEKLLSDQHLAIVQGVGYPNPTRSHFDSMDIWHSADPTGRSRAGWLGQASGLMPIAEGRIPVVHLGDAATPLALQGAAGGVPTINPSQPYGLELGETHPPDEIPLEGEDGFDPRTFDGSLAARKQLIRELAEAAEGESADMADFVRRLSRETYSHVERLNEVLADLDQRHLDPESLEGRLEFIGRLIRGELGGRIYFVSLSGFDTHGGQREAHDRLLGEVADAVASFFKLLTRSGEADRVVLLTFSEFGRRVQENSSRGTDHGAASTLLLAGPSVQGGLVGERPSLSDLDGGDLRFHTDFRRVYATLIEDWLGCDSRRILGETFDKLPLFRA